MWNRDRLRAPLVVAGLCAFLTLGVAACSSLSDEGDSTPTREQLYGGDNRDRAPVHQEKMRERSSQHSAAARSARS
jgi:hypothetical protein